MDILDQIIANKRIEVARQKEAIPLNALLIMGSDRLDRPTRSMRQSLAASPFGIIAEFKRKSPSKGWIHPGAEVNHVVPLYEQQGASACSVLTDGKFFGGSLGDLQKARKQVKLPLLRKDFIVDPYQLFQARIMGADAVLLIASCLTTEECFTLAETAHTLQLEVLLEIHRESELTYLNPYVDMLGVNNRNLGTFDTRIDNSFRLAEKMQQAGSTFDSGKVPLLIAESGISSPADVKALKKVGFQGFLIGETFMKRPDPGIALSNFISELS
ncbi:MULTISPECIES: indole-3-glycerol phosphate synthase TrpC [unclassified Parabacteroides]|uniref:indole-3-glycerol phosphate synthase TrpC n=1 Tax=unclassified Parabacteroides TaxID=2649774 RepID=UPI002475AAE5|nr:MULTISPECIES: indole-3-glycerol phosphate synthase TrpC [unclassified Parabacteroides]